MELFAGQLPYTLNGRTVYSYRGIPYGEKPVRFQRAEPAKRWKGVRNATEDGPMCVQLNGLTPNVTVAGQEDCLNICVYTVYDPKQCQTEKKLPVMVWIYGGGWTRGSNAQNMYAPTYMLDRDILLVVFNYRLDAFGYLSTGDEAAPGNWGLTDQVLALKWVKQNIKFFGGDPDQVTLFGGSTGGVSVHLHCSSPLSKGLFHRMISQSGVADSPRFGTQSAQQVADVAKELANAFGCPTNSSTALVQCLRNVSAYDIITKQAQLYGAKEGYPPFQGRTVWTPVDDSPFTKNPFFACNPRNASCSQCSLPWINGFVLNDGASYVCFIYSHPDFEALIQKQPYPYLSTLLSLATVFPEKAVPNVMNKILKFYFKGEPISRNTTQALANVITDTFYYTPALRATFNHSGPVYFYRYDFAMNTSYIQFGNCSTTVNLRPTNYDDVLTLFDDSKEFNRTYTESILQVIKYHVDLWTNFATTGGPTSGYAGVEWDTAGTEKNFSYEALGDEPVSKNGLPYPNRYTFWKNLLQEYNKD